MHIYIIYAGGASGSMSSGSGTKIIRVTELYYPDWFSLLLSPDLVRIWNIQCSNEANIMIRYIRTFASYTFNTQKFTLFILLKFQYFLSNIYWILEINKKKVNKIYTSVRNVLYCLIDLILFR